MSELLDDWKQSGDRFEHPHGTIFYRRSADERESFLCLHGFPTASFDYHLIWKQLAAIYPVTAFDMIGYGFSSKPATLGYTTFDQVDVLESLLTHLKLRRVHIVAHDYGNTITQELLARQAEGRLDVEIASICFLNGALFPETHRPIIAQKLLIGPLGALFGRFIPDPIFRKNLASVFGERTQPDEGLLDDYLALFKHNRGKLVAHKLIRYMRERETYRERWVRPLTELKQPFRFINGSADPVSGKHLVERFRQVIPDQTDIIELTDIGHFPHVEAPEVVFQAIREFHEQLSSGSRR